ncbi:hypothetical protein ATS71_01260 [Pseudoalteromonas sp. H71]|nr:hypothetical protein ATS71_01260 [Pseudoalteromonas sp. H71]
MKSLTIALFLLALITSWSSFANIDIEYQVTEVAGSNTSYGLSVIAPASDPEQLVPYWHRKAVKICGSKKYKASALIKKETQCGDAIKVTSTGEKCEVIPASVFGTLSCNGIKVNGKVNGVTH